MSQPPQRKTQECFKCRDAGAPNTQIYFDGKDATTDRWIIKNPDGTLHEHKKKPGGQPQRKIYRVVELIECNGVKEANALLMGNKMIDYLGFYVHPQTGALTILLGKKEAVN